MTEISQDYKEIIKKAADSCRITIENCLSELKDINEIQKAYNLSELIAYALSEMIVKMQVEFNQCDIDLSSDIFTNLYQIKNNSKLNDFDGTGDDLDLHKRIETFGIKCGHLLHSCVGDIEDPEKLIHCSMFMFCGFLSKTIENFFEDKDSQFHAINMVNELLLKIANSDEMPKH